MITITGQREIAGCSIFRDDADALAFYVMPQSPRVALDETGKPVSHWCSTAATSLSSPRRNVGCVSAAAC
jgi:hypothetical protein